MEKRVRLSLLLDLYGAGLTNAQRDVLRAVCDEDLTLSEIAQEQGTSRQAVHHTYRRGEDKLLSLEAQLGAMERELQRNQRIRQAQEAIRAGDVRAAERILTDLLGEGE